MLTPDAVWWAVASNVPEPEKAACVRDVLRLEISVL